MNHPLISVIGPTATGKSALALSLAQQLIFADKCAGVEIISADSRQVYHDFPILSGADLDDFTSLGFQRHSKADYPYHFFSSPDKTINLHGIGIIDFTGHWSLGLFFKLATPIISRALEENKVVIIVGGTLLYHQRLLGQNSLTSAPPNPALRTKLETCNITELQQLLFAKHPLLFSALNNSDKHNPRRLIRHLEVLHWQKTNPQPPTPPPNNWASLHQYLMPDFDLASLRPKIKSRVEKRFALGAIDEVASALAIIKDKKLNQNKLALPLGFAEIASFLHQELNEQEALDLWELREWQYVRRQLTFLKKLLS
ncbi:hypothetical protein FWH30_01080 [Microgenomates group bacterium]|nr:hypothetical protein [Microgenomates group bacterium]